MDEPRVAPVVSRGPAGAACFESHRRVGPERAGNRRWRRAAMTQQFDPLFATGRSGNPYDLGDFAMSRLDLERESAGWTMADTVAAGLVAVSLLAVLVL